MLNDISDGTTPLTAAELDPLFWHPARHGVDSAWYGHVPFAHWLVGVHRPASIVELGAHNGVSYSAFCEAALRFKLDTRAVAVDTWQGDEHAGFYGEDVYAELRQFHDQRYAAFSTLLRTTFDEALQFVSDGSVDLLHIDGRHRYEDVAHDFATWRVKLSNRALVLFHDTNVHEGDFGVWRLWSELRSQYRNFEFLHGHGLGVLALGEAVNGPAADLCTNDGGGIGNIIRERFSLLGDRWIAARDLQQQTRLAAYLNGEIERITRELAETRAWGDTAQAAVNKYFPELQQLGEHHRRLRAEMAQARYDVAARDLRLVELTADIESRDAEISDRESEITALRGQAAHLSLLLQNGEEDRRALERDRALILGSTSWRLTAPLRRVLRSRTTPPIATQTVLSLAAPAEAPAPAQEEVQHAAPEAEITEVADGAAASARPRALFISGESHTPGHIYRIERAVETARRLGYDARWTEPAPVGPADLAGIDLVVLWRLPYSSHIQGIITVTHEQGGLIIFDVDDLMFRPEIANVDIIDGIRTMNLSEFDTQNFFATIARTLRASDAVTCPTEELAHQARRLGRPAYVLPNGFDRASHDAARMARRARLKGQDDLLRIGYAGGSRTHQRDFATAAPAILRILQETPKARLTLFRDPSSGEGVVLLNEYPAFATIAEQIEWRDMVPLADLPMEIARFTVSIAPLEHGNPFCEAKSELKFFEASMAGVPTIASPTGPFARAIADGETGFLAADEEAWYSALRALLSDAALRHRIAQSAYHACLGRFGPEARADFLSLMLAQIRGGEAGAAAFERDRYRAARTRPQPPLIPESDVLFSADRLGQAAVTVIMPVFNYADYVPEALASVADQSLALLDLVVVDDASPDDSGPMVLDWIRAHEARFNRVLVLKHRQNAGLGLARNSGFAAAETEFVLPLDADNRLRAQACETLAHALEVSAAAFAYPMIQEFGDKTGVFGENPYSTLRLQTGNYIDAMALVRKSAWAEAGGYDHPQHGWEDFDFWCRLAELGRFGISVPQILADYRVHAKSMLHTLTDIGDHRADLCRRFMARHPWLDIA